MAFFHDEVRRSPRSNRRVGVEELWAKSSQYCYIMVLAGGSPRLRKGINQDKALHCINPLTHVFLFTDHESVHFGENL
ncbi:hypothetical protein NC651_036162 [Populus alba x Populus x berolinensis]|nr:hypothetical protein NC651_036162 [Populus alba x Populus x berolinensis]